MATNLASKNFTIPTILNVDGGELIRTFFTTAANDGAAKVAVSAGAINNISCDEIEFTVADGDKTYIHSVVDDDGFATAITIEKGSSVPDDTDTDGYTLLANVSVTGVIATVTPLAWNYSQMQTCGIGIYLWGGFGE